MVDMSKTMINLLCIFIIGVGAVIAGLVGFVERYRHSEGFRAGHPGLRCGVDLPACVPGTQCINGFCAKPEAPALPANELPVFP
jgi:hypothetical protein